MINSEINSDSVLSPNERLIAATVAVIIHIFLAILLFVKPIWESPIPAPEPAGVTLISFGNVLTPTETPAPSQSDFNPPITESEEVEETQEVETLKDVTSEQTPNIQTTKNENTVSVPDTKKDKKEEKKPEKEPEKKEEKKVEPKKEVVQEPKKEEKITPAKEDKKSDATNTSNEDGDSKTKDKQGNSDDPNDTGKIGVKDGAEISVVGWRWIKKPQPNDVLNEQGKIVFDILIDQNGNVIKVTLIEKSPTIGIATYTAYKNAVLNTKFQSTLSKPAESTSGTLTFNIKVGD
jgi:outer membrane biosynthesis protein TonB